MNKLRVYLTTLILMVSLKLYYSDLSGIKNFVVEKIELAHQRLQKELLIRDQYETPLLPNEALVNRHHDLISGNVFTLPTYLSQSSEGAVKPIQLLDEPQCRGSPARAP
jgi:hypothetical protein